MTAEVDWHTLDKRRFFVVGLGLFSGVTTALYPLSVIKTRQMADTSIPPGISGSLATARKLWRSEGIPGFYRGINTAIFGTIPTRMVYISVLEATKSSVAKLVDRLDAAPTTKAAVANFCGGAAASLASQTLVVPIDVVTQRMMVQGLDAKASQGTAAASSNDGSNSSSSSSRSTSTSSTSSNSAQNPAAARSSARDTVSCSRSSGGADVSRHVQPVTMAAQQRSMGSQASSTGRGLTTTPHARPLLLHGVHHGASSSTAMLPQQTCRSSSMAAGAAQVRLSGPQMARLIVQQEGIGGLYRGFIPSITTYVPSSAVWWGAYGFYQKLIWAQLYPSVGGEVPVVGTGQIVAVQVTSSILAGFTTGLVTNPLDLVKTRMQVAAADAHGHVPSWSNTLRTLLAEEGVKGLLRGAAPRMASSALWGTCMVSCFEYLKRLAASESASR